MTDKVDTKELKPITYNEALAIYSKENDALRTRVTELESQLAEARELIKRHEDATVLLERMVEMEDTFGEGKCLFKTIIENGIVTNMMAFNLDDLKNSHRQPIIDAITAAIEAASKEAKP